MHNKLFGLCRRQKQSRRPRMANVCLVVILLLSMLLTVTAVPTTPVLSSAAQSAVAASAAASGFAAAATTGAHMQTSKTHGGTMCHSQSLHHHSLVGQLFSTCLYASIIFQRAFTIVYVCIPEMKQTLFVVSCRFCTCTSHSN